MNATQNEKAARFRALHDGPGAFAIPNPWDVGSVLSPGSFRVRRDHAVTALRAYCFPIGIVRSLYRIPIGDSMARNTDVQQEETTNIVSRFLRPGEQSS